MGCLPVRVVGECLRGLSGGHSLGYRGLGYRCYRGLGYRCYRGRGYTRWSSKTKGVCLGSSWWGVAKGLGPGDLLALGLALGESTAGHGLRLVLGQ